MNNVLEVLRLGHRPKRDERLTSHVCLTARALGADGVYVVGRDSGPTDSVDEVTRRFGGEFEARLTEEPRRLIREWNGDVVHLTMYGLPLQDVVGDIRGEDVLVVVGSQKVGWDVFEEADYNVAVTNQPHSEVAALAVFLHEYWEGQELGKEFSGGEVEVVPSRRGKETRPLDGEK